MGFDFIKRNQALKHLFVNYNAPNRRVILFNKLKKTINKKNKILNLGCGTCLLDECFKNNGYLIDSIDIYDGSLSDSIIPTIYDGKKIPAKKKQYDLALILSVLHHVNDKKEIIKETKRVAKSIIIQEDIIERGFKRDVFSVFDNFINLDFNLNQNNYYSLQEWKDFFKANNVELKSVEITKRPFNINQATFYLKCN